MLHESWWSDRLDLWEGNLLFEFVDALLELLLELLLLGFSGGCGFKGSLLLGFSSGSGGGFSLCENGLVLSFSLGNDSLLLDFSGGGCSLDSLVYCSLFLFLEVFGGNGAKLEQVALVISLLSLVLLKFISELLFSLSGFFQLCF